MIPVYIKVLDSDKVQFLGEFMPHEIKPLVKAIKRFGVLDESVETGGKQCEFVAARFYTNGVHSERAYFEIVVMVDVGE
jgi:hypothetical protein